MTVGPRYLPFKTLTYAVSMGLAFFLATSFPPAAVAASPLNVLIGSWGGSGTMTLREGRSERIRCNSYYTGGGSQLRMAVRCKGGENSVELRSALTYSGGRLSGSWEERTFNLEGTATGSATSNSLRLSISGGVSGSMTVTFSSSRQKIYISTKGVPLKSVSVTLSRR